MFTVEFYETDKCVKPALDFILSIKDQKLQAKVFRSLKLLESYGNRLGEPNSASLREGIYELRTKNSSNIVRTLYFFEKGKVIIVTNSFIKKSQKTPKEEIETALERKKNYEKKNKQNKS